MTRVLVTGAAGFIGLPVITQLARRGHRVEALSRGSSAPEIPGVTWHRVDLVEEDQFEELIVRLAPEQLVHIAWYTEHKRMLWAPENVIWVERSLKLLRAFVRAGGRRALMLGSCAEYDWSAAELPLNEAHSRLAPATLYGASKDALRRVARAYSEQQEFELAWARPFFLYGPREDLARLVPAVTRSLLMGEPVAVSSGEQIRDYMHVDDVAAAIVALLDSRVLGEVNLGSGVGVSVGEIVGLIAQFSGRPELIRRGALGDRPWEPPLLIADADRLHNEVGHRQCRTLTDGLAATTSWWQERVNDRSRGRL